MKYAIMAALAAAGMTGAASWASTPEDAPQSIRLFNINGYSVIDEEHVLLRGGGRKRYLVTLTDRCQGLDFGIRMATSFPSSTTLYHPTMEYISSPSIGRCYIDTVEEVENADAARALITQRSEAEAEADAQDS